MVDERLQPRAKSFIENVSYVSRAAVDFGIGRRSTTRKSGRKPIELDERDIPLGLTNEGIRNGV